ncbi:MAG: precorrin-2 C(20)-methyltransferase [Clostridia bacterium]|nr:precorrin-2 C(20)-methyltransferase [Clostridia bacterium]
MNGKLYCIGVGPGDPELLTLKAVRLIRSCPALALPAADPQKCVAYQIILKVLPEAAQKQLLPLDLPMKEDPGLLREKHLTAARAVAEVIHAGKDVAFLTLGDPTLYCTFSYLQPLLSAMGITMEYVSGVSSFCAAAARLKVPLVRGREALHVIPALSGAVPADSSGAQVLLKAGKNMDAVKALMKQSTGSVFVVENCGMENEHIYRSADELPEKTGYLTLVLKLPENREGL